MSITLNANNDGSGSVQTGGIDAIQISAAQNVTVPNNLTVTNASTFTGNVSGVLKSGTAVASTSGTSIDFTGIPSTAKRITVVFNNVSTSGSSVVQVQAGSTTFVTSGYTGSAGNNVNNGQNSSGFLTYTTGGAGNSIIGHIVLTNISGNLWVEAGVVGPNASTSPCSCCGAVTLSGVLDRVRITTVNGTDTFDAGTVNIMWE